MHNQFHLSVIKTQVNCKKCLKSAGLYDFFGEFHWFCASTLMVYLGKKNLSAFPHRLKIGHSYGAFTYLFSRNISTSLLSGNKITKIPLLIILNNNRMIRSIRDSTNMVNRKPQSVRVLTVRLNQGHRNEITESRNYDKLRNDHLPHHQA